MASVRRRTGGPSAQRHRRRDDRQQRDASPRPSASTALGGGATARRPPARQRQRGAPAAVGRAVERASARSRRVRATTNRRRLAGAAVVGRRRDRQRSDIVRPSIAFGRVHPTIAPNRHGRAAAPASAVERLGHRRRRLPAIVGSCGAHAGASPRAGREAQPGIRYGSSFMCATINLSPCARTAAAEQHLVGDDRARRDGATVDGGAAHCSGDMYAAVPDRA